MKFNTYVGSNNWKKVEIQVPDGKWALRIKLSTSLTSHPQDKRFGINQEGHSDARLRPHTQVVTRFVRVLGVAEDAVTIHQINDHHDRESHHWINDLDLLLVCDQPFAVLTISDDQEFPSQSGYRRASIRVARQVHKGELSQTFRPVVLRSTESDLQINHAPVQYVQLKDVAQAINIDPLECLRTFAVVSPSSYYEANASISHRGARYRIYETVPQGGDCTGASQWGETAISWETFQANMNTKGWHSDQIFIPMAWARDILILAHFGFIPGVNEKPERSFLIKAEQPEPYTILGLLPVLPIDEIRELRGSIQKARTPGEWNALVKATLGPQKQSATHPKDRPFTDRDRSAFECWVETVTGHSNWAQAQDLNDTGSFVYHNDFRVLRLFNDRLSIATSFWSRGGADKGQYWAGFIAVHPEIAVDPRREPALYRLMIWPDQILRQTPIGVEGGFFPEIEGIEPEIMETIRQLIRPCGFTEMKFD
ncbi:hypothetical protein HQ487_00500 [Candidatus Uhrbacteria bacterium]|nr:hypothetical protein [Candidatus Uhrbacteria bacterium]